MKRDIVFDILRGLAIVLMIAGNSMGNILEEPHPYWLRCIISVVAPMFIMVAGAMVALGLDKKSYDFMHFLKRGAIVFGAGMFLEIIVWGTWPFTIFEVLYLIGVSIPLTYLFLQIKNEPIRWLIIVAIIAVTPILQNTFGYTDYPTEYTFPKELYVEPENPTSILNHYFVDGWFPIFPWLAFAFIGANLYSWRQKYAQWSNKGKFMVLALGLFMIVAGAIIWQIVPPELVTRDGYSELFYPPTIGFIIWALGADLVIFVFVDKTSQSAIYKPIIIFGNAAMFVYIAHYMVIESVMLPFFEGEDAELLSLGEFFIVDLIFTAVLFVAAYAYLNWKKSLARK